MLYKVKEVSNITGVSVRTLHHYDEIGILKPKSFTESGYRLYSEKELQKLQEILFFKELDFSLNDIRDILNSKDYDRKNTLTLHKKLLLDKRKRLDGIIESLDKTIESIEGGFIMSKNEMFKGFDISEVESHKKQYKEEARKKYGGTDAYKVSEEKTSKYTKTDWERITEDMNSIYRELAALMDKDPEDDKVQELIHKWRMHISENFYNCTPEIFRGLGELYISDSRFTENIDKFGEGLANFLSQGIEVYCNELNSR